VRAIARIFTWPRRTLELWRAYASHSPNTTIPANDGAFYFFLTIFGFEILITGLHAAWILHRDQVLSFGIAVAAVLFIVGDALYARLGRDEQLHAAAAPR
jgi:hypothetical protein